MQGIRRNDFAARIEILPLIDVVFLLLTFFIYSMFVMVRLDMLSVDMVPLGTGRRVEPSQVESLTVNIDRLGKLLLGKQPVTADSLIERLRSVERGVEPPMIFVALSKDTDVDRAPVVLDLMKRFVGAGFKKYTFVGPPTEKVEK
jgi:biopolymer transport protein ExbD